MDGWRELGKERDERKEREMKKMKNPDAGVYILQYLMNYKDNNDD
jgi:hypothetical protein